MFEIIPSPGTENKGWSEIEAKIDSVKPFVKCVHIDIIDGVYVNNKTFSDPLPFAKYTKELVNRKKENSQSELFFEVHLMVDEPVKYLKPFADAGFRRFIGQIEKMSDQAEFLAQAQLLGEASLAIDKQSPVEAIKVPLDDLDSVLVMTIQAGYSGQKFEEPLLQKVKTLRSLAEFLPIEVDGGINDESISIAAAAGANRFVATSFIFGAKSPEAQYNLLKKKLSPFEIKI